MASKWLSSVEIKGIKILRRPKASYRNLLYLVSNKLSLICSIEAKTAHGSILNIQPNENIYLASVIVFENCNNKIDCLKSQGVTYGAERIGSPVIRL